MNDSHAHVLGSNCKNMRPLHNHRDCLIHSRCSRNLQHRQVCFDRSRFPRSRPDWKEELNFRFFSDQHQWRVISCLRCKLRYPMSDQGKWVLYNWSLWPLRNHFGWEVELCCISRRQKSARDDKSVPIPWWWLLPSLEFLWLKVLLPISIHRILKVHLISVERYRLCNFRAFYEELLS